MMSSALFGLGMVAADACSRRSATPPLDTRYRRRARHTYAAICGAAAGAGDRRTPARSYGAGRSAASPAPGGGDTARVRFRVPNNVFQPQPRASAARRSIRQLLSRCSAWRRH